MDPASAALIAGAAAAGTAGTMGRDKMPKLPELPAPVEDVDVAGQQNYLMQRLRATKGRQSTVLASKVQKKQVLG